MTGAGEPGSHDIGKERLTPTNCTPTAISFLIAMIILLTIIHLVRLVSVRLQRKGWEVDNIFAHAAYGTSLAMMGCGLAWSIKGGTNDITTPPPDLITKSYLPFIGLYYAAVSLVKFSLLLFYARIFTVSQQSLKRRFTEGFGKFILSTGVVLLIWTVFIFICFVSSVLVWTHPLKYAMNGGIVYQLNSVGLAAVGIGNAVMNITLLGTATWGIWHTQMPTKKKKKATGLVGFAIFPIVASIFRACQANIDLNGKWGPAYQNLAYLIVVISEPTLGYLCLCAPAIKDVFFNRGYLRRWYNWVKKCLPSIPDSPPFQRPIPMMNFSRHRATTTDSQDTAEITLIEVLSESPKNVSKADV